MEAKILNLYNLFGFEIEFAGVIHDSQPRSIAPFTRGERKKITASPTSLARNVQSDNT